MCGSQQRRCQTLGVRAGLQAVLQKVGSRHGSLCWFTRRVYALLLRLLESKTWRHGMSTQWQQASAWIQILHWNELEPLSHVPIQILTLCLQARGSLAKQVQLPEPSFFQVRDKDIRCIKLLPGLNYMGCTWCVALCLSHSKHIQILSPLTCNSWKSGTFEISGSGIKLKGGGVCPMPRTRLWDMHCSPL